MGPIHPLHDHTLNYSLYPFTYPNPNNSRQSQCPLHSFRSNAKSEIIFGRKSSAFQPCFLPATATSAAGCRFSRRELEPAWRKTDEAGVDHSLSLRRGLILRDSRMLSLPLQDPTSVYDEPLGLEAPEPSLRLESYPHLVETMVIIELGQSR